MKQVSEPSKVRVRVELGVRVKEFKGSLFYGKRREQMKC
jgi:hypothetical protein